MSTRTKKCRRGFTLVEALAVVTMMAIILPVVMKGVTMVTEAAGLVRQRAAAMEIASNQLTQILVDYEWQNGDSSGEVQEDTGLYRWTSHVEDWEESSLHLVTLQVQWDSRGKNRTASLATLVYDGELTPQ
jgi:type II secretion system protein I